MWVDIKIFFQTKLERFIGFTFRGLGYIIAPGLYTSIILSTPYVRQFTGNNICEFQNNSFAAYLKYLYVL